MSVILRKNITIKEANGYPYAAQPFYYIDDSGSPTYGTTTVQTNTFTLPTPSTGMGSIFVGWELTKSNGTVLAVYKPGTVFTQRYGLGDVPYHYPYVNNMDFPRFLQPTDNFYFVAKRVTTGSIKWGKTDVYLKEVVYNGNNTDIVKHADGTPLFSKQYYNITCVNSINNYFGGNLEYRLKFESCCQVTTYNNQGNPVANYGILKDEITDNIIFSNTPSGLFERVESDTYYNWKNTLTLPKNDVIPYTITVPMASRYIGRVQVRTYTKIGNKTTSTVVTDVYDLKYFSSMNIAGYLFQPSIRNSVILNNNSEVYYEVTVYFRVIPSTMSTERLNLTFRADGGGASNYNKIVIDTTTFTLSTNTERYYFTDAVQGVSSYTFTIKAADPGPLSPDGDTSSYGRARFLPFIIDNQTS